jgi:hypothetical protein
VLLLLRGKSYYTAGLIPFMIATGGVFWEKVIRTKWVRILFIIILVGITIPIVPMGIPVFKAEGLATYFEGMKRNTGFDAVLRDEDGNYNRLPQDYSDMIGWEELTANASKAYQMVQDKTSCFIYCENYGQAGAITVLGKKYGLPQPVCFSESFFYWAPKDFPVEIQSAVYINHDLGEDIQALFSDIRKIGEISNPLAREQGTTVYLCQRPVSSFNAFYRKRILQIGSPF